MWEVCRKSVTENAVSQELALKIQTTIWTGVSLRLMLLCYLAFSMVFCRWWAGRFKWWTTAKWIKVAVAVIVFGGLRFMRIIGSDDLTQALVSNPHWERVVR